MLLKPKYMARFRDIASVLVRHGFSDVLAAFDLQRFLPGRRATRATPAERLHHRAQSLRSALEELGPTYIKLGQILSTRPDILPLAYLEELERLQDRVAPIPFDEVRRVAEGELGKPLTDLFETVDEQPLASASLAQVHQATMRPSTAPGHGFRRVIIKTLRPGVEEDINIDIELLGELAEIVGPTALGQRYNLAGIVDELGHTMREEIVLTREAHNTEHFRSALKDYDRLRVPRVVDELTTQRVFVAEYINGRRVGSVAIEGIDPRIADQLWRAYLKQLLVDGTFHCDPHPGNFLLDDEGRIAILDFGMVAHLSRETQLHLLSILLYLAERDGEHAADVCMEIGIPGPRFHERRFRGEIALMVARYGGRPLGQLNLGKVVLELVRAAYKNDIQIPPEMLLVGKTLLNLEGLCRRLDPDLDPVSTMRTMATALLAEQMTRELTRHKALSATLEARAMVTEVPTSIRRLLRRAASNELRLAVRIEEVSKLHSAVHQIAGRITLGLITAALIIGSALLLNVAAGPILWGYPIFALVGFLLAAGLGIYLVVKIVLFDAY